MPARDDRPDQVREPDSFAAVSPAVRESFVGRRIGHNRMTQELSPPRLRSTILWIDGVGSYWVCRGSRIVLGQFSPNHDVDLPIWGDVSRRHALIVRDDEGDALEALRPTRLDGIAVPHLAPLADGRTIQLGESVTLRYRRPHPLSRTARLEWLGAHRTQPATDGVLLFAETCIIGPAANSHIVSPRWRNELILAEVGAGLKVRYPGEFRIDGQTYRDAGPATWSSRIVVPEGNVTLEDAG